MSILFPAGMQNVKKFEAKMQDWYILVWKTECKTVKLEFKFMAQISEIGTTFLNAN